MKVLFAMPYPGYLRYFDSVVTLLAERGHTVELWFETLDKQPEGLVAIDAVEGVSVGGKLPKRRDGFEYAARASRLTLDFVRYYDPLFAGADYLRDRVGRRLEGSLRHLRRWRTLPSPVVRRLVRAGLVVERALPRAPEFDALVIASRPDLVVGTPVVMPASRTADLLKSATALGVPTVGAVASWDNFTTKGVFRVLPDRVLVWNETQADEGVELHALPRERIAVTGAQPFDRWFDRLPSRDADAFRARVGLPPGRPYVLFTGSTASITHPDVEIAFVKEWLRAIRGSLGDLAVMVRPHPYNSEHWDEIDLGELAPVVVWPPTGGNPVDDDDRADYFDSIHHASAVVGINTTAMIEAAIQRKPVLSIELETFQETQSGTVHFGYLLPENGGFLRVAHSLDEHLQQLREVLADPIGDVALIESFLSRFVRPRGLDRPCTPLVVDVLEEVAAAGVQAQPHDGFVARGLAQLALRTILFSPGRGTGTLRQRVGAIARRA
ncbi:MAG TPA: hypothetical protein VGU02_15345 [Gaiellaceae bacterium]|nr:hypothetical protein [Gaiellaceae bacterium]